MKLYFLLLFSLTGLRLWAGSFLFTNDAFTWGFVPEWDDWETNAFSMEYDWGNWFAETRYSILTDRDDFEVDSSRIDGISFSGGYGAVLPIGKMGNLELYTGLGAIAYGDFGGFEIQGGWHKNVEVSRNIPEDYESPFYQIFIPSGFQFFLPFLIVPSFVYRQTVFIPWQYNGYAGLALGFPEDILPLELEVGYNFHVGESGVKTIDAFMEKQKGFVFSSRLDFWPLTAGKKAYFNGDWGTGYIGFLIEKPRTAGPEEMVFQFCLTGINNLANGVKVMRRVIGGKPFSFLYTGVFYESLSGWMNAPYVFPDGGRFSEILLGIEEGSMINLGPVRLELYFLFSSGYSLEQFYQLDSTALIPLYTESLWSYEWGGGARIFSPFFYGRKVGLAFELTRKSSFIHWGNRPDDIAGTVPLSMKLSLAVSR